MEIASYLETSALGSPTVFTVWGRKHRFCNGLDRREFLRIGGFGLGCLTLADLLRSEARGDKPGRPKSVIYIVLGGGPSHIDTYDLKPDAPEEYRGPFQPISTRLPGVQICELMPRQAEIMNRLALLRGIRSVENDHFLSEVYTGLPRTAGKRPAFGSVVSRLAGNTSPLPTYVSLDRPTTDEFEYEKPYYAGAGHAPFRPFGEALQDLQPVKSLDRLQDRKTLLATFDTMRRDLDRTNALDGSDRFQAQALEMLTSPRVRDAFDLSKVPDRVLARYGKGKFPHQTVKNILYDWDARPFLLAPVGGGRRACGHVATRLLGPSQRSTERHLFRPPPPAAPARLQPVRPDRGPARPRPGSGRPGRAAGRIRPNAEDFPAWPGSGTLGGGRLCRPLWGRLADGTGDRRDRLPGRTRPQR